MKTVIVTCDRCQVIINQTDVLTGIKYVPGYIKYELNCGGVLKEFCSMHCMELQIHTGDKTKEPIEEPIEGIPISNVMTPILSTEIIDGKEQIGYPQ